MRLLAVDYGQPFRVLSHPFLRVAFQDLLPVCLQRGMELLVLWGFVFRAGMLVANPIRVIAGRFFGRETLRFRAMIGSFESVPHAPTLCFWLA
jgi:hypothetical protein